VYLNETCSKFRIGKHLPDGLTLQKLLKEKEMLFSPLLCNVPLKYAIKETEENLEGLELKGTSQLMVYADINSINKEI
jgi:hypothetical protein